MASGAQSATLRGGHGREWRDRDGGGQAATWEMGESGLYSGTGTPPMPLLAGHTYTLTYDQLIPIVIGEPVQVPGARIGARFCAGCSERREAREARLG